MLKHLILFCIFGIFQIKAFVDLSTIFDTSNAVAVSQPQAISAERNSQSNTLQSIGYFGLGLYGAGIFERYATLNQELKAGQQSAMDLAMELKSNFEGFVVSLGNRLRINRESLEAALTKLIVYVEEARSDKDECNAAFEISSSAISSRIKDLDVTMIGSGASMEELLNMYIDYYGRVLDECRAEYPHILKQIDEIEICVRNFKGTLDVEAIAVKYLINEVVLNYQSNITALTGTVTRQVNNLIKDARNDFKACVG